MEFKIYTDGAASPNPGIGGAAAIISKSNIRINQFCFEEESTNQRMEISGIILGLYNCIKEIQEYNKMINFELYSIKIYSDSAYCVNCMNQKWYKKWEVNGWKNAQKKEVSNRELWKILIKLLNYCESNNIDIEFIKVKGHCGDTMNEEVDSYAVAARKKKIGIPLEQLMEMINNDRFDYTCS